MKLPALELGPDSNGNSLRTAGDRLESWGPAPTDSRPVTPSDPGRKYTLQAGWINAHTHIYSGLAPLGMPPPAEEPENFVQILERIWWRLDRALDEKSLAASARYYAAESLLAGTTTLIDHHESPAFIEGSLDVLADACQEVGIRAVLCYGATERNGGSAEAERGLAECRRFIRSNDRPLVRGLVGLHASFTVSDDTVRSAGELCRELGTVLHVHVAEDQADVEDAQERGYAGPLERLLELGALPPGSIIAHGVHCTADQVRTAREHGLWFVQNPRSNRGNGVGYATNLKESGNVAIGTDGYPAVKADEAAALFAEAAVHDEAQESLEARLEASYRLAAERFDASFAPLSPGAMADVVAIRNGEAGDVVVGGRQVVANGELQSADVDKIRTQAKAQADRLWKVMAQLS